MGKTNKATFIFWLVITAIPIIGVVIGIMDPQSFQRGQEIAQDYILPFGIAAPLAFIVIQALQVIITPISHYSVGVVGGFIWGPWIGMLLNWIGRMIGHIIVFFLARKIGRRIVERFVREETLQKYDKYVSDKSFVLFLMYFAPLFPDDELSYLAGFSKMKFTPFLLANIFGQVGGSLGLAYIGSGIDTKDTLFWVLTIGTLLIFPIIWWLLRKERRSQRVSVDNEKELDLK